MRPLFLGYDEQERGVRLPEDERLIHMHVIGSSGSGKSKFLEWIIRGDLDHRQGFCLIDPEGTLYEDIVSYCAHWVQDDIILLNLSKPDSIIPYTPFKKRPDTEVAVQVDHCINATLHAWNNPDADKTPTLRRTLRLIYTVLIEKNLTLPQAQHFIDFDAGRIREQLVEGLRSPLIEKEWRKLNALQGILGWKQWKEDMLSATNRLYPFLTSPTLCRFMGVPGASIDLTEIMEQGKVLLVNLAESGSLSYDNARIFGALLMSDLYHSALRRERDAYGADPSPYYCYIDEFQEFVSLDVAKALARTRKRGLYFVLSHQGLEQLEQQTDTGLAHAIDNCRIKVVFGGLGVPGARKMAEEMFIGDLDPLRIKFAIWQTKFWPEYRREKVYTKSSSQAIASSRMESLGYGSMGGSSTGEFHQPGAWWGMPELGGTSTLMSTGSSQMSARGTSRSDISGEAEAEADIPIFFPVPFQEVSSIQTYTIEEQLWELSAALKEQYQRHCFIKIHNQKTQPMLVPFVKAYDPPAENRAWYVEKVFREQKGLPVAEVDRLIKNAEDALVQKAGGQGTEASANKPPRRKPKQKPKWDEALGDK